jgi:ribosomal protein S12 methylthiotransferase accessory factor
MERGTFVMHLQNRPFSPVASTLKKALRLVDEETGIVRMLYEAPLPPDAPKVFGCGSLCGDYSSQGHPSDSSISGSTSLSRDQAIAGAIGEAVERYSAGFVPYEQVTLQPYSFVADHAISPRSLTLYDDDQYQQPTFGYKPVGDDTPIGWVEAHSLTHHVSKLVPAFAVYQPYQSIYDEPAVFQQVTTGLACGNTLEEAILSAICEVVERDAAMLMWLQRRRLPNVVLTAGSRNLAAAALDSFGWHARYVRILDATTDWGIPSYVTVWDGPIGKERGGIFSSCSSLSAERAIAGALTELAQCLMWASSLIDRRKALPDPLTESITEIEEHVLWPLRPTARPSFQFALSSVLGTTPDEHPKFGCADVLEAIQTCVGMIGAQGYEVLVVDVTSPDIRESGLHVVRVIIPGAQPLFFGTGMHRVSERGRHNYYPARVSEEINFHPHPFP